MLRSRYAEEAGLEVLRGDGELGLLPGFGVLASDPWLVGPEALKFYERTARYRLEVTPRWTGPLKYSARTLTYLVGRNIGQLNLPPARRRAASC